jgi:hypothetical protein
MVSESGQIISKNLAYHRSLNCTDEAMLRFNVEVQNIERQYVEKITKNVK